jgi:RHS repeat-associated protein
MLAAKETTTIFPLAALTRNSHPAHQLPTAILHPGFVFAISNTATSFHASVYDFRSGPRCSGYYRDSETGLDYAVNRYHQPGMGRFLSVDLGGPTPNSPGSWNRYAYAMGDPINGVDRSGREVCIDENPEDCQDDEFSCAIGYYWDPFIEGCVPFEPYTPTPQTAAPFCNITVQSGGTPQHNDVDSQNPAAYSYGNPSGSLGQYTTFTSPNIQSPTDLGWFFAAQVQATLNGDANPADWTYSQSETSSGTLTGLNGKTYQPTSYPDDTPNDFAVLSGSGYIDWLDLPGQPQLAGGTSVTAFKFSMSFVSTISPKGSGTSCTVRWQIAYSLSASGYNATFSIK